MNNAFQTPDWNGYGVTNEAKPAKKRNPIMNALSTAFEFGAPEAFHNGRMRRLEQDNMQAQTQQIQMDAQNAANQEKMRMAYEGTKLISQEPDVMRRIQLATDLSQQLGMPAPTDPSEFSDHELQKQLEIMRIRGGFEEEQPEAYTLAPGARRFEGNQMVAENPKVTAPQGPDWQRTTIDQNGVPTIVEYDRNAADPQASMRVIGSEFNEPEDAGGPDSTGEGILRREFNSLTRQFRDVHSAYNRITATDTSTPAGQMGLIFQYMKMLDPASTVREGEYATAQNTTGIPGQVLNAYNRALDGEFLTPAQITDFESQAKNLYGRAEQIYSGQVDQYRQLAQGYQFDPSRTVMDVRGSVSAAQPQSAPEFPNAPPIGTVEDGFRYVGGPPDQQASWERVS